MATVISKERIVDSAVSQSLRECWRQRRSPHVFDDKSTVETLNSAKGAYSEYDSCLHPHEVHNTGGAVITTRNHAVALFLAIVGEVCSVDSVGQIAVGVLEVWDGNGVDRFDLIDIIRRHAKR